MEEILDKAIRGGMSKVRAENILFELNKGGIYVKCFFNYIIFTHEFLTCFARFLIDSGRVAKEPLEVVKRTLAIELVLSEDRIEYLRGFIK